MADTSVVDLDADLVGLGRSNLDVLDAQRLAGLPGDGGLAGDGLENEKPISAQTPPRLTEAIEPRKLILEKEQSLQAEREQRGVEQSWDELVAMTYLASGVRHCEEVVSVFGFEKLD